MVYAGGFISLYISYPRSVVEKTNSGNWTEHDQAVFDFLYGSEIPGVRQSIDYQLDKRKRAEYFHSYSMDYGNVHDPRNLPGAGNTGRLASWALNYTSHNLNRLYRGYDR